MKTLIKLFLTTFPVVFLIAAFSLKTDACSRVMYQGPNGMVLTARSMDWYENMRTNLWIFPRGMQRSGEAGKNMLSWKSKYGSVVATGYDISSADGMNERGLAANLLWLSESEYPVWDQKKPRLPISAWVQYVLDNFATVDEAVNNLKQETFALFTLNVPGKPVMANLHLSLSDSTGDNAIFEYIGGKLVIHHDRSYQVMTNSPIFEKQMALDEYWKEIGGSVMLPGTNNAADRFVRASYYIHTIPQTDNTYLAVASVFSVIRNVSVPIGVSTPGKPNISSTLWRTVADQKDRVYYFESAYTPNVFWVDFKTVNFSENAPVKKLSLTNNEVYAGSAAKDFIDSNPFTFYGF
ncbi:MAG: linear amide C-N hydrolase [Bacteroidales bacterium]|jgi:choloylglycine hydrolase|nr:linear amide C-N hydrolase [Bacteroidales bacterium]